MEKETTVLHPVYHLIRLLYFIHFEYYYIIIIVILNVQLTDRKGGIEEK